MAGSTRSAGATIANLNTNLDTAQFYEGMSVYGNGAIALGGTQDNGTPLRQTGTSWTAVLDGDGGYTAINPLRPTQQFAEADHLLYRTASGWEEGDATDITPPGAESDGNVNTLSIPPIALSPNRATTASPTVYYGAKDLWVTHNPAVNRPTWTRLTHETHGNPSVSAIAVAPSNDADVYVGLTNGVILASKNATSPIRPSPTSYLRLTGGSLTSPSKRRTQPRSR